MIPDAFDADRPLMLRCACGQTHADTDPHPHAPAGKENLSANFMEAALVKALFPVDAVRRGFLKAVGAHTARAAIASLMPLGALQAMAQERGALEKKDLNIGFIGITCASPLIMADPLGLYKKEGLNVTLRKTAGWGMIRDKMISGEHDASHFLSPMPLAMSLGLGSPVAAMNVATIQNNNGQAITLSLKHKDRRDPKQWKGFKLGIPFEHSMHNYLLRYYLAEKGVNPDTDLQIVVVPPPEMVAKLKDGSIDGFLGPDPFNQRAVYDEVGFIHLLSKEIWDGHPCCAFGMSDAFIQKNPNTFAALYRAVLGASFFASVSSDRSAMAKLLAPTQFLNQPEAVLTQVLTGKFPDGLGNNRSVPDRAMFDPVPWQSMAVWMLTQMKRWGYIKGNVDYKKLAEEVFLLTDAKRQMSLSGWRAPEGAYKRFKIMGKDFDPTAPDAYVASFPMHRMG